jgi:hypothetical protein
METRNHFKNGPAPYRNLIGGDTNLPAGRKAKQVVKIK